MVKRLLIVLLPILFIGLSIFAFSQANKKMGTGLSCQSVDFTGQISSDDKLAVFEGREVKVPRIALEEDKTAVLGVSTEERWIEIDLSEQKLKAWEGKALFLETPVSSGLPWWPTPTGEFNIWIKLRATKMEGGEGKYYYYLPNVPFVMFFANGEVPGWRGFSLHGTYWHNDFGIQRSHGCVNLPTPIAEIAKQAMENY